MSDDTIEFKDKGLKALMKALKGPLPVAQVGVIGSRTARTENAGLSNADIGLKHEFGEDGLPIRSFLRMPLTNELSKFLEKSGLFTEAAMAEIIKAGSLEPLVEKLGITGVAVVLEGFETGGFGEWKPSNMNLKKVKQTLVETQQLRDSVSYQVK